MLFHSAFWLFLRNSQLKDEFDEANDYSRRELGFTYVQPSAFAELRLSEDFHYQPQFFYIYNPGGADERRVRLTRKRKPKVVSELGRAEQKIRGIRPGGE